MESVCIKYKGFITRWLAPRKLCYPYTRVSGPLIWIPFIYRVRFNIKCGRWKALWSVCGPTSKWCGMQTNCLAIIQFRSSLSWSSPLLRKGICTESERNVGSQRNSSSVIPFSKRDEFLGLLISSPRGISSGRGKAGYARCSITSCDDDNDEWEVAEEDWQEKQEEE